MTTASALFPAQYVSKTASERIKCVERQRSEAREERIKKIMETPIISGFLWCRKERLPSREKAEAIYVTPIHYFSPKQHVERDHNFTLSKLRPLLRLSRAAEDANPTAATFVSLTAADCRVLDIPSNLGVSA
jgi:hypothetical protein